MKVNDAVEKNLQNQQELKAPEQIPSPPRNRAPVELYNRIENIVSRLHILRDAFMGVYYSEKFEPNLIWFKGGASILREAIDQFQDILNALDRSRDTAPLGAPPKANPFENNPS